MPVYCTAELLVPGGARAQRGMGALGRLFADGLEPSVAIRQQTQSHPGQIGTGDDKRNLELNYRFVLRFELEQEVLEAIEGVRRQGAGGRGEGGGGAGGEGDAGDGDQSGGPQGAGGNASPLALRVPRVRLRVWQEGGIFADPVPLSESILDLAPMVRECHAQQGSVQVPRTWAGTRATGVPGSAAGQVELEASCLPGVLADARPVGVGRDAPNRDPFLREPRVPEQKTVWEQFLETLRYVLGWILCLVVVIVPISIIANQFT